MMEHYDFSESRAAQVVNREDKRRLNLYRKINKTDYDNPALYHLVLNMAKMNLQTGVKLILDLVTAE
jgi:cytidylate kinase